MMINKENAEVVSAKKVNGNFFKVTEEKCGKGIKSHFSIGQIVSRSDIEKLKIEFSDCMRDTYEDLRHLNLDFYKLGLFRKRTDVYSVKFLKQ